jgi:indolepyruvate ferredoxin oxidoreductase beta subunit
MSKTRKNFNIVIVGVGGQGLITLTKILSQAALLAKLDVKTSELHGLSQRGGSVETSIRFGKKIYSPLVKQGGADLIISLELQEALKSCYYASKESETLFLLNDFFKPLPGEKTPKKEKVLKELRKFSKKVFLVPGTDVCKEKIGKAVLAGIFIITLASFKGFIPLKPDLILKAIKKIIPEKYLELNLKTFNLAKNYTFSI